MPKIILKSHENVESALRRFKRVVSNSGNLIELKEREQYEKPSVVRKKKLKRAVLREKIRRATDHPVPKH